MAYCNLNCWMCVAIVRHDTNSYIVFKSFRIQDGIIGTILNLLKHKIWRNFVVKIISQNKEWFLDDDQTVTDILLLLKYMEFKYKDLSFNRILPYIMNIVLNIFT